VAAIAGIGYTKYTRSTQASLAGLALEASLNAVEDAGMSIRDIDGLVCYHQNDSVLVRDVSTSLGIKELRWWSDILAGGTFNCAVIAQAAMAIESGLANNVVVYRALKGRSGKRMGRYRASLADGVHQFMTPFGFSTPAEIFGMTCRRHMHEYGTTREQLGRVAVTERLHASLNDRAVMRQALTMEEYLAGRIIADPYTLFDCCQETDGACAVVLTSSERAQSAPHGPVFILGAVHGGGSVPRVPFDGWPDLSISAFPRLATELFERARIAPSDVDVALLYDAFTFEVIQQIEDFGFCEPGEGGPFVEDGNIALTGRLPVNPHGGLLSEAYIHGLNHVIEAVQQLRSEAGSRQVRGAEVALVTGFGFCAGSAMLLGGASAAP